MYQTNLLYGILIPLAGGFTVNLDCDISEVSFSSKHGGQLYHQIKKTKKLSLTNQKMASRKNIDKMEPWRITIIQMIISMHITGKGTDCRIEIAIINQESVGTDLEINAKHGG
jgi:bleomycin hydrolase